MVALKVDAISRAGDLLRSAVTGEVEAMQPVKEPRQAGGRTQLSV
jgi:hypothetical protein